MRMSDTSLSLLCVLCVLIMVACLAVRAQSPARVLPAEAAEAVSLERASFARSRRATASTNRPPAASEASAFTRSLDRNATNRVAWDDYALSRDGVAPTNDWPLIRAARWKILSVQSVTNSTP